MRSFEERKKEIFLRSEERIKARTKKRRQLLALCIPLCLVVLSSAIIIPNLQATKDSQMPGCQNLYDAETYNDVPKASNETQPYDDSGLDTYAEVKDSGTECYPHLAVTDETGKSLLILDTQSVESIMALLDFSSLAENQATSTNDYSFEPPKQSSEAFSMPVFLDITLSLQEGKDEHYTLKGNTLTNSETGASVILAETQLMELLALLGKK